MQVYLKYSNLAIFLVNLHTFVIIWGSFFVCEYHRSIVNSPLVLQIYSFLFDIWNKHEHIYISLVIIVDNREHWDEKKNPTTFLQFCYRIEINTWAHTINANVKGFLLIGGWTSFLHFATLRQTPNYKLCRVQGNLFTTRTKCWSCLIYLNSLHSICDLRYIIFVNVKHLYCNCNT